jgi:hypothetical protein
MDYWQGRTLGYLNPLPGKGRALWNLLKDFQPKVQSDIMDLQDPYPGIREGMSLIKQYGKQILAFYLGKMFTR